MMRKLFLLGTGAFWLAVLGIWLVVRSGGEDLAREVEIKGYGDYVAAAA